MFKLHHFSIHIVLSRGKKNSYQNRPREFAAIGVSLVSILYIARSRRRFEHGEVSANDVQVAKWHKSDSAVFHVNTHSPRW